jgi:hypothetical protein
LFKNKDLFQKYYNLIAIAIPEQQCDIDPVMFIFGAEPGPVGAVKQPGIE